MTEEVKAVVSFGTLRRGDRLQVDIHDPAVAGLIHGGYLKVIWKERGDVGQLDSADGPDLPGLVSAGRVDSGVAGDSEEEDVDGTSEHRPGEKDPAGA